MDKKIYENVEFSFGKGIGGKIYDAINNAKDSVFVLAPYVSQGYIGTFCHLYRGSCDEYIQMLPDPLSIAQLH